MEGSTIFFLRTIISGLISMNLMARPNPDQIWKNPNPVRNIIVIQSVPSAFNNLILKINQKIATAIQIIPKTICIIFTSLLFSFELSEKYFVSIYEFYRQFIFFFRLLPPVVRIV